MSKIIIPAVAIILGVLLLTGSPILSYQIPIRWLVSFTFGFFVGASIVVIFDKG